MLPDKAIKNDIDIFKKVYFVTLFFMSLWRGLYFYSSQKQGLYQATLIEKILPVTQGGFLWFLLSLLALEAAILLLVIGEKLRGFLVLLVAILYVNLLGPTNNYLQPFDDNIILPNLVVIFFSYLPFKSWFHISARDTQRLLVGNIAIVYFSAFLAKMVKTGWAWSCGEVLQLYLYERSFQTQSQFTLLIAKSSTLCLILSSLVLFFEATFFIVVWENKKIRWAYILFGLGMHISILVIMDINFLRFFFITYLVFIPYSKLFTILGIRCEKV